MIRPARVTDKPQLLAEARRFHATLRDALPFEDVAAARTLHRAMEEGIALVLDLGGVKGGLVAVLTHPPFSSALIAQEVAFWIAPEARGRWGVQLVRAYEDAARAKGAVLAALAALDDATVAVFRRLGFHQMEIMLGRAV